AGVRRHGDHLQHQFVVGRRDGGCRAGMRRGSACICGHGHHLSNHRSRLSPMRRGGELSSSSIPLPGTGTPGQAQPRSDWSTLRRLFPYLWEYKWRALGALVFMIGAKLANVAVPWLLKHLVDAMDIKTGDPAAVLVVPAGLLVGYGLLRLSTSLFTELRDLIFSKATQG